MVSDKKTDLLNMMKCKEIISILDCDVKFEEYEFSDGTKETIRMPYLSGRCFVVYQQCLAFQ